MATATDTDRIERLVLVLRMLAHPKTAPAGLSDSERTQLVEAAAQLEHLAGLNSTDGSAATRPAVAQHHCGCPGCEEGRP